MTGDLEISSITWGDTRLPYAIRRSARRKKTVAVTVDPAGDVRRPRGSAEARGELRPQRYHPHRLAHHPGADAPGRLHGRPRVRATIGERSRRIRELTGQPLAV